MIIWSGRGFLSVLVLFLFLIPILWIVPKDLSDYGFAAALFISAGFSWFFGEKWNSQLDRIVTDDATGQKIRIRRNHTLFWIPMQYWGIIFSVVGVIILFQNSLTIALITSILLALVFITVGLRRKDKTHSVVQKINVPRPSRKAIAEQQEKMKLLEEQEAKEEEERLKRKKEKEDPNRFMPQ